MRFNLFRKIEVWDGLANATISVEENDNTYINITTKSDIDKQCFGDINVTLHKDAAKLLATAILELSGE